MNPRIRAPYRRRPLPRLLTFLADSGADIQLRQYQLILLACGSFALRRFHQRKCFRTTSFSPDQMPETAHTLTSTRSVLSAMDRIRFSSRSVDSFEAFFGHETQIAPELWMSGLVFFNSRSRAAAESTKMCTISQSPVLADEQIEAPSGSGATHVRYSGGALTTQTRAPDLMPSFFPNGVPEYPLAIGIGVESLFAMVLSFRQIQRDRNCRRKDPRLPGARSSFPLRRSRAPRFPPLDQSIPSDHCSAACR